MKKFIGIIGGGIVGLATALQLLRRHPDCALTLWEKEKEVAQHQSTHNSGVLHAGLYYKPGSAKARLAVRGIRMMKEFCQQHNVPYEICGKLVVACSEDELPRLQTLHERGVANGLQGLERLTREQIKEIEPHAAGIAAVRVPEEGIVDYAAVCKAMEKEIARLGGKIFKNARVQKTTKMQNTWRVQTSTGEFESSFLINCAGLHCDRVCQLTGEKRDVRIVPFRGEYYKLTGDSSKLVKNLIYPVPDAKFPFLGVHFTRLIHGGIEAGPNAVLAFAREGYKKTDINLLDLFDALSFPGLWRFLAQHPRMCAEELLRAFSKKLFCKSLQRLVPDVQESDLATGGSGVRAQAMSFDGTLVQDFHIIQKNNCLHVLNAPSPAATASLAIGEEIVQKIVVA
ncbi:MAG: L-2-hydroxyglutarate oxidase [Verrucomicrobiota bacterium]